MAKSGIPRSPSPLPEDHEFIKLLGSELVQNTAAKGEEPKFETVQTADALGGKSSVALYFSAHWCPPCRQFTPLFADRYTKNLKEKGLEVIFVSSDRDEAAFKSYYGAEHPWLSLPYAARDKAQALSKKCKVEGIPSVCVFDAITGKISNLKGRSMVMEDETGDKLPWAAPTLGESLGESGGCVIL